MKKNITSNNLLFIYLDESKIIKEYYNITSYSLVSKQ